MSGRSVADIVADLRDGDIIDRGSGPVRSVALVDIEAADLLERLDRLAELLAAALLIRGVEAKDCDALDEWLRP